MQHLQTLVNGVVLGALYACLAVGFSLVWGVLNIVNMLHGSFIIFGGYLTYYAWRSYGVHPLLALPAVAALLYVVGYLTQLLVINRVVTRPVLTTLTLTFGLDLILYNFMTVYYTATPRRVTLDLGTVDIAGIVMPVDRLLGMALALLLTGLLYFVICTHALPAGGMMSRGFEQFGLAEKVIDLAKHLIVPVLTLVLASLPVLVRHVRASMIEVLNAPFIAAARGHGISRVRVLFRYALPAGANPLISLFGLSLAGLLSGSLLVEVITGWPGLGPLLLEASISRDLYVVIGLVMSSTVFMIMGNLLADALLVAVDPRVRTE